MSIELEEGKRYLSASGGMYGPMVKTPGVPEDGWCFSDNSEGPGVPCWRPDGSAHQNYEGKGEDLVAELRVIGSAPVDVNIKAHIAAEAARIVEGARRGAYGQPEDNFARIANFWNAYFTNTGRDATLTAADVSPMMRLMKEARLCETPDHYDSHIDLVGYALTGAEVNNVKIPLDNL